MARGLPVACTRDSAPGEVAGDAGLALDPTSEASIAQATLALFDRRRAPRAVVGCSAGPRGVLHVGALRRRDACGLRAGARAGLVSAPVSGGAITQPDVPDPPIGDVLDTPEAGRRVVRGGALRVGGFVAGLSASLVGAALVTRHLGPADYGRYQTVVALVTIVQAVDRPRDVDARPARVLPAHRRRSRSLHARAARDAPGADERRHAAGDARRDRARLRLARW